MSVTREPGGCQECPTCRGEVVHEQAFLADLGFAILQSRRAVASAFWRAVDVRSGMWRAACARDPLTVTATMRTFDETVAPPAARSGRVGFTRASFNERAPAPKPARREMGEAEATRARERFETPLPVSAHDPHANSGRECCVKTFAYPDCWAPTLDAAVDPMRVGLVFRAAAEYWPKSEQLPNCDCSCCEFRQYVSIDYFYPWADAHAKKTRDPVEDCVVKYMGSDNEPKELPLAVSRARNSDASFDEYMAQLKARNAEFVCTGRRSKPGRDEFYDSNPATACKYKYLDHPHFDVPRLSTHDKKWYIRAEFIGRIVDTCQSEAVKADARFSIEVNAQTLVGDDASDPDQMVLRGPPRDKRKAAAKECE